MTSDERKQEILQKLYDAVVDMDEDAAREWSQAVLNEGIDAYEVVEHDIKAVMSICDRIIVLNFGRKIAEDLPEGIKQNREVIEAYLGSEESG